ncbi:MAG: UDP-N-acetylmuramoyl-tripeptide--D-alanyl-D-alanine ligase [Endomicrobium sp.]|jgi:UDP-N-acetylmuramoyl-tripeptide--D-alanyl-D-alanine ligase|nr:UDP-N-acetylmuramoyl-tripeptide--D-alanyl-D-alanine ligase [Endomicrobium sp.]
MESFYLKDLIKAVNGKFLLGDPSLLVKSVSIDSRTVKKGQFYFAIKGKNYDGHDFIKECIEREAGGIVYSRENIDLANPFPRFPSIIKVDDTLMALGELAKAYVKRCEKTKVVGITGSNGKTTTKEILTSILSKKGKTISNKGNFNNRIGLPLSALTLQMDTDYAVFEMGTSLNGEIKILTDIISPDAAVVTNIGYSHLETFGSPMGVFKEKRALFDGVSADGFIVLNADDEILKSVPQKTYSRVITFGLYGGADVYARNITLWSEKPKFELYINGKSIDIEMPVQGKFNMVNALAAAAVADGFGFSPEEIKAGIESFVPPSMRMETVKTKSGVILINDAYNANPSSVKEAIQGVCESYPDSHINLVLGDMLELGEKAADYHSELGVFIDGLRKIENVYLLGKLSANTKNSISKKNAYLANDSEDLLELLSKNGSAHKTVYFFKGSRGMKLEEVYDAFRKILD